MAAISKDSGAATLIGPSIVISGKISGDEDLTVRGRVEGTLELTRGLVVDPGGIVKADVSAKSAVISGVVVGNIRAEDSVELTRGARVVGDITAPRVIILDGAAYRGRVDMSGAPVAAAPRASQPASRPVSAPARVAAPSRPAAPARPMPPPAPPARPAAAAAPSSPAPALARASVARAEGRPLPPPAPPAVAAASRKKVIVRKRK